MNSFKTITNNDTRTLVFFILNVIDFHLDFSTFPLSLNSLTLNSLTLSIGRTLQLRIAVTIL